MNCQEFELSVRDLARSDVGGRSVAESHGANEHEHEHEHQQEQELELDEARLHGDACEACALRLQDERALNRKLDALATEMTYFAPPVRIEAALLRALRQASPGSAGILPASSILRTSGQAALKRSGQDARAPRRTGGTAYWITAAAAVLLIVFGIALVRAKLAPTKLAEPPVADIHQLQPAKAPPGDSTPAPGDGPGVRGSAGSIPADVSPAKGSSEITVHRKRTRPRRLIPRPAKDDGDASLAAAVAARATPESTDEEAEPEIATQFIALSYVAPANLQDGGQIVRVELPRSAMASFGLPVNMERLGERVKADVLVSADGFARAIRFVQ